MANWHEGVTHTLEIAITTDPLDAVPVWTDVTTYYRGPASTFRGSTSTDMAPSPGTYEFVLENGDRRFDPTNTAGPYYGNLKPMKRVRWRAEIGGTTYTVFSGFVSSWKQQWGELDATVRLVAVEGFFTINRLTLPSSAYAAEVVADSPVGFWTLQDDGQAAVGNDLGFSTTAAGESGSTGAWSTDTLTYPLGAASAMSWPTGANATATMSDASLTDVRALDFWVRSDNSTLTSWSVTAAASTTSWLTISASSGNSYSVGYSNSTTSKRLPTFTPNFVGPPAGTTLHVAVSVLGNNLIVIINGTVAANLPTETGTTTLTNVDTIPGVTIAALSADDATTAAGAISNLAVYAVAPSQTRFQVHFRAGVNAWSGANGEYGWETDGQRINRALDDAGWPTNMRNIVTGSVMQAPYIPAGRSVLDYIREVAESGAGFVCFDVNGNVCYRDREWAWTSAYPTGGGDLEWGGEDLLWGTVALDWGTGPLAFTDDGTGVTYMLGDPAASDIDTVRNVVTVAYERGGITQRDATSITEYGGEYSETVTARTIALGRDAANLAAYRLRNTKDAADTFPELVASLRDGTPETQFAGVLGAVLGQVIEVTRTPMNVGSAVTRYGLMAGIRHEVDAVNWVSTLSLVAAPESAADAGYGIVGTSTAGASTVVPY